MHDDNDINSRLARLETEVRSLREEVQLNRRRYHELSSTLAPVILEGNDVNRHEMELREIRSAMDKMRGVWSAITILATVMASLVAGMWALLTHLKVF